MDVRVPSLAALTRAHGTTPRRRTLVRKLRIALAELRAWGFSGDVFVGGSFITDKWEPGDVDVVLDCSRMADSMWPRFARAFLPSGGGGTHSASMSTLPTLTFRKAECWRCLEPRAACLR
jgi:hypothetical protein